jgi:hypothetical protein
LSDAPAFSDELSSDVPSSIFIEDVPFSPSIVPSSLTDFSPEQHVRRNHYLRRPPDCYSPSTFTVTALSEPPSYRDTILHLEWQHTMAEEIAALERTGTWYLVPCPPRVCPITCKWVYKVKTRSEGSLEYYKARLVARDFQQEQDRDYDETFAPVAHMTPIRTLLIVASVQEWSISQLNAKNVFLNGELREDVYMRPPPGYSVPEGMVCHLCRPLYGLKQAPRVWFQRFTSVVTVAVFSASAHDPSRWRRADAADAAGDNSMLACARSRAGSSSSACATWACPRRGCRHSLAQWPACHSCGRRRLVPASGCRRDRRGRLRGRYPRQVLASRLGRLHVTCAACRACGHPSREGTPPSSHHPGRPPTVPE